MESQRRYSEEGEVDVDVWKSKLVTRRLTMRRQMMDEFKYELSERKVSKRKSAEEGEVGNYWDPAEIPEEIWLLICNNKYLDTDSVLNMLNTCQLFRKYLEVFVIPDLFRQVLPILLQKNYVSPNDVLNCRLVSKPMCLLVDKFFESKDSWKTVKSVQPYGVERRLPSVKNLITLPIPRESRDHPRNPFVGKAVIVSISLDPPRPGMGIQVLRLVKRKLLQNENQPNWNVEAEPINAYLLENLENEDDNNANGENDASLLSGLESCGTNIWHLFLKARLNYALKSEMIVKSLSYCRNLRTPT